MQVQPAGAEDGVTIKVKSAKKLSDDICLPLLDTANLQAFICHVQSQGVEASSRSYYKSGKYVGKFGKNSHTDSPPEEDE